MPIASKALGGAAWSILAGLLSRAVGLAGTLVMTRFLAPEVMGEVTTAVVLAFTVNWATHLGFAKYLILRSSDGAEPVFHVLVLSLVIVGLPLMGLVAASDELAVWFSAPHLTQYLPGMALTVFIRRIGSVPEKLLSRDMRFGVIAGASALAEVSYSLLALLLVMRFHLGGQGVVYANIVQAALLTLVLGVACGPRNWLTPVPIRMRRVRDILAYGAPLGVIAFLYEVARYADKLVFTKLFGPARTGEYSLASNLADVPAVQVGEQVANVLLPTLMQMDSQRRPELVVKAVGMLLAVILPMSFGLSMIAPTLVEVLLPARWWGMTPFLAVLAATSIFRPVNALLSQFLMSAERNHTLMHLEVVRVAVLFAGLLILGQWNALAATFAVGAAGLLHLVLLLVRTSALQVSTLAVLKAARPSLASASVMAVAIFGLRQLPVWHDHASVLQLVAEFIVGCAVYVATYVLIDPVTVREFRERIALVLSARR
ncbi:MAG: oligosaccharide flippase family protein [Steroidobacteraceae bacterium]